MQSYLPKPSQELLSDSHIRQADMGLAFLCGKEGFFTYQKGSTDDFSRRAASGRRTSAGGFAQASGSNGAAPEPHHVHPPKAGQGEGSSSQVLPEV